MEIKELSTRCEVSSQDGMACGPCGLTAINAEMVIEEDGIQKYLICTWVSEADDAVSFEITQESIFDYLSAGDISDEELEDLDRIRENGGIIFSSCDGEYSGKYTEQYNKLIDMVRSKIIEEGFLEEEDIEF